MGEAVADGASRAWQAGQELVDAPIDAGLSLGGPRVRVSAILPSPDVRQLRAMRTFLTDRLAGPVTTQMTGRVNAQIGLIMVGAQTPAEAADQVGRILESTRRRARTIIRTELGRAYSTAGQERMGAAKKHLPGLKKQWRRSGKFHSRIEHDAADGQVQDVDEPFRVGGVDLMYPRDPAGPPRETINCGCQSLPYMGSWAADDVMRDPGRRPFTDEERAAREERADLEGRPSPPLPGAPEGWLRWRREAAGPGREAEAVELGTISKRVAKRARAGGLNVARGRKITFSRPDYAHAARSTKTRRPLAAADLDRVPEIVARPQAVIRDLRDDVLIYAGAAEDGVRMIKVVIRPGQSRTLKMGRGQPTEAGQTNYVRTLGYVQPNNLHGPEWRLLDGSLKK